MYLVGLTGGIASGKSTVAARLVEHGAIEVDADLLARAAVEPGSKGLAAIARRWPEVIDSSHLLNRKKLADIVFSDSSARQQLEEIVHPEVRRLAAEAFSQQPANAIVVYTVPLLVEANVDHPFDFVITVEAPESVRISRLVNQRGMSPTEAEKRVHSQASPASRANRADLILNSNKPLPELLRDVDALWERLLVQARANGSK